MISAWGVDDGDVSKAANVGGFFKGQREVKLWGHGGRNFSRSLQDKGARDLGTNGRRFFGRAREGHTQASVRRQRGTL